MATLCRRRVSWSPRVPRRPPHPRYPVGALLYVCAYMWSRRPARSLPPSAGACVLADAHPRRSPVVPGCPRPGLGTGMRTFSVEERQGPAGWRACPPLPHVDEVPLQPQGDRYCGQFGWSTNIGFFTRSS